MVGSCASFRNLELAELRVIGPVPLGARPTAKGEAIKRTHRGLKGLPRANLRRPFSGKPVERDDFIKLTMGDESIFDSIDEAQKSCTTQFPLGAKRGLQQL